MQPAIIYEDEDIIVCKKPAGVATQTRRIGQADMESLLKNYRASKGELPYIGVVHRLDQPVEGIMVFAKNKEAAADLSRQIKTKLADKYYYAMTDGVPEKKKGTLEDELLQNGKTNTSEVVERGTPQAKHASLSYEVVEQDGKHAVLRIKLDTGRHHQIRTQLAHIGCPIKGDLKYGAPRSNPDGGISLLSHRVAFVHPVSKQPIDVVSPLPDEKLWRVLADSRTTEE